MTARKSLWVKAFSYDDEKIVEKIVEKMSYTMCYSESCFNENVVQKKKITVGVDVMVSKCNDEHQCQLNHEARQWIGHNSNEVEGTHLKTEKFSIQSGVKRHGEKERSK